MNANVKVLDCTLRDGTRIVNCAVSDGDIRKVISNLSSSNVDIIEVGFIRNPKTVTYKGESTFFTYVNQINKYLDRSNPKTKYVAFIDYDLYDFSTLEPRTSETIDGVRIGFKRTDYENSLQEVKEACALVKKLGYELYIQGVNSLGYTDQELLGIIDMVNDINPNSFGIVDTYGGMYSDDVKRIYTMVDHNLNSNIAIDFHSHNNFQLSFSLAQEVISLSNGKRDIIIDATLNGMGKGAGNLNTELLVDYLNRKLGYDYDFDLILDTIDEYTYKIKSEHQWGYSIPSFMAGVFKSHPNNIIYLTEKFRLNTKDIKYILSMLDEYNRQHYNYDLIQEKYVEYNSRKKDDSLEIQQLRAILSNKKVLLVAPGNTINDFSSEVARYIEKENPVIISVNFVYPGADYVFWGSEKRYKQFKEQRLTVPAIVTSNVKSDNESDVTFSYEKLLTLGWKYFDNSMIMLLHLLKRADCNNIAIAGLDGYDVNKKNYFKEELNNHSNSSEYHTINKEMFEMLDNVLMSWDIESLKFITPSQFSKLGK